MAVTKHTLTGDLGTIAGTSFLDSTGYAQSVRAWLETNLAGDALIDTLGNVVMLGVLPVALAHDLTFTQPNLVATNSTDVNPTGVQYRMHVSYPDLSRNQQKEWVSNWFDLTANVDLADVVAAVATPPNYQSDFLDEVNALLVAGEAAMDTKLAAGQALLDEQIDFSGIDTSDAEVATLISNKTYGPLTQAALAEATADHRETTAFAPFNAALRRRDSRRVNVVVLGDSVVEGFPATTYDLTLTQHLARVLRTRFPTTSSTPGGRGFVPIPTAGVTLPTPWTTSGGALDPTAVGAPETYHVGPARNCWYTNGSGTATYQCGPATTSVDLHHVKGASGGATGGYYKINGGAAVPFATNNGTTIAAALRITVPAGASLEFGCNSPGAYIIIAGVQEHAGDETKGIQVHNAGHSGYTAAKWAANPVAGGWRDALALLNPDLLVIHLGVNDANPAGGNRTPAQLNSDMTALITTLRAGGGALATAPIMLVGTYDTTGAVAFSPAWSNYIAALTSVAVADPTVELLNLTSQMPTTASDTRGLYYAADHVHGAADGSAYEWIAQLVADRATPGGSEGSNTTAVTLSILSASIDAEVNTLVPPASTIAQGKVELATTAETTTGIDTVRAVTPIAFMTSGDKFWRVQTMNLRREVTPSGSNDRAAVNTALAAFDAAGAGKLVIPRDNWLFTGSTGLALTGTSNPIHVEAEPGTVFDMTGSTAATGMLLGGSVTATTAALGADAVKLADTITCSLTPSAGDILLIQSTDIWDNNLSLPKGELAEVLSVAAGVITLKSGLFDSYAAATTTVTLMQMPEVTVENLTVTRNSSDAGLQVAYARRVLLGGLNASGARERLFYVNNCFDVTVDNCHGRDFWYTGTGTSYGLSIGSSQHVREIGNDLRGGRHAVAHGGTFPTRDVEVIGGTFDNYHASGQASFDFHPNCEQVKLTGPTILNGLNMMASNFISDPTTVIRSVNKEGVYIQVGSRACDYIVLRGDIETKTQDAIAYYPKGGAVASTTTLLHIDATVRSGAAGLRIQPNSSSDTAHIIDQLVVRGSFKSGAAANGAIIAKNSTAAVTINERRVEARVHATDGHGWLDTGSATGTARFIGAKLRTDKANNSPYNATGALDVYFSGAWEWQSTNATKYRSIVGNTGIFSLEGGLIDGAGSLGGISANAGDAATAPSEVLFSNVRRINTSGTPGLPARNYARLNSRGNVVTSGTAAPTAGAWAVGDICENSAPAAGSVARWVCTAAGSPGTWVPLDYVGTPTATTSALAAIGNAINTTDKTQGKTVFNTTTGKLVTAVGATAGSVWNDQTGATAHTPV